MQENAMFPGGDELSHAWVITSQFFTYMSLLIHASLTTLVKTLPFIVPYKFPTV